MESQDGDSAAWLKPGLPSSSHSCSVSKALSAGLDSVASKNNSPHLSLLHRLVRIIEERRVLGVSSEGFGVPIGGGATYQVEKKMVALDEEQGTDIKTRWTFAAAKRAKVLVPKKVTAELGASDETYRRLQAVLLEVEILTHPRIRRHPNIASLLGYAWDETAAGYAPILIMELATSGDARNFLASEELSDEAALSLCRDIASGLEALHVNSIVHGDVKLENILIYTGTNGQYLAKVSDLERSPQNGDCNVYRGTKIYNAPEVQAAQQRDNPIPRAELWLCDVFSFGLLVLEVLSRARWYGELPEGDALVAQVLGSATVGKSLVSNLAKYHRFLTNIELGDCMILQTGLKVIEKLPNLSPTLRRVIEGVLQHTLPSVSERLRGGWELIRAFWQDSKYSSFILFRFSGFRTHWLL